jgi:hypothetical protein
MKDSLGVLRQLLVISAIKGLIVVDMATEKILDKKITQDANVDYLKVVPGSFDKFVYIAGAKDKNLIAWELRFDLGNNAFSSTLRPKLAVPGFVLDFTTFWDHLSQKHHLAAVISDDDKKPSTVRFYEIHTNVIVHSQTWTMKLPTGTTFVKIDMVKHLQPNRNAAPTSIGCFPATTNGQKSLILLYTEKYSYFWGFLSTETGNSLN